jgi:hypothetical protein
MNVKKIITGLALLMLLSSGAANADWGDVYYCQETNHARITLDGKMTHFTLEKFQFKLDQTSSAMVFGNNGYFSESVFDLIEVQSWPELEDWYAKNSFSTTYFGNGKFLYSQIVSKAMTVISADCDKF